MNELLIALKALIPIIEPIGEQGVNQLWTTIIDPYIASMGGQSDMKNLMMCLSPAMKQFVILELQKLKV